MAAEYAAKNNVVVFDVDYRLVGSNEGATKAKHMIGDFVGAIHHIYNSCSEYDIDKRKIGLAGIAGGGFVVMQAGGMLAQRKESGMVKLIIAIQALIPAYYLTDKKEDMLKGERVAKYDAYYLI